MLGLGIQRSSVARLLGMCLVISLYVTVLASQPAEALTKCDDDRESGCTFLSSYYTSQYGGSLYYNTHTFSWYVGTINNTIDIDRNGSDFWNTANTCYGATSCSLPTEWLGCGPGVYIVRADGWRTGKAKVSVVKKVFA